MDNLTPNKRSKVMSSIKSKHSKPEVLMRSMLHRLGFRFRVNKKELPGKPDIVLPKHKVAIFVHGCFWHMHKGCKIASMPSSNRDYWIKKLKNNKARDKSNIREINKLGWRPYVVWECEIMDNPHKVADKVCRFLLGEKSPYKLPEKKQMLKIAEKRSRYLIRNEKPPKKK